MKPILSVVMSAVTAWPLRLGSKAAAFAFVLTLALLLGRPSLAGASEPYGYLVPGDDYPSAGPGFAFFEGRRCSLPPFEDVRLNCYAVGTQYPRVPVYVYEYDGWCEDPPKKPCDMFCGDPPEACGAQYNPDLIAGYALTLQKCCDSTWRCCLPGEFCRPEENARRQKEHCSFLPYQMTYFAEERRSPHKGLDVWPFRSNGFADGMAQAKIARIYLTEYWRSCGTGACNPFFFSTALRATKAFDWGYANGGVAYVYDSTHYWYVHNHVDLDDPGAQGIILNAHNLALYHLYALWTSWRRCVGINSSDCPTPNPFKAPDKKAIWDRLQRGLATLRDTATPERASVDDFNYNVPGSLRARSYYRVSNTGEPLGDPMNCDDGYHVLNYDSLNRLVDLGLDYTRVLRGFAIRWQYWCGY